MTIFDHGENDPIPYDAGDPKVASGAELVRAVVAEKYGRKLTQIEVTP
jgi:hypothetical protein